MAGQPDLLFLRNRFGANTAEVTQLTEAPDQHGGDRIEEPGKPGSREIPGRSIGG